MESLANIFELNINGEVLEDEVLGYKTDKVTEYNNVGTDITSVKVGSIGTKYVRKDIDAGALEIEFSIVCETNALLQASIDEVKKYLNEEDFKFSYFVDPTYYQIGNLSKIEIDEWQSDVPLRYGCNGKATIQLDKPIKYSTTPKEFTMDANGRIQINNAGNIPCDIDYEIDMVSDNGYIGIRGQGEYDTMEYGSPQEADGEYIELSEYQEIDHTQGRYITGVDPFFWSVNSGFSAKSYAGANVRVFAQVDYEQGTAPYRVSHHGFALPDTFAPTPTESEIRYRGLRRRITLDSASKDFTLNFQPYFASLSANEMGLMTIGIYDTSENAICGFSIVKGTIGNGKGNIRFYISSSGQKGILCNEVEINCVENVTYGNSCNSQISISKIGDNFIFNAYSKGRFKRYPMENEDLIDAQIGYVDIGIYTGYTPTSTGQVKASPIARAYMNVTSGDNNNYVFNYVNENVENYNDLPNRYTTGDKIVINGTDKTIYNNGLEVLEDEVLGTNYFKAPCGASNVQLMFSNWATTPNVKAIIREQNI